MWVLVPSCAQCCSLSAERWVRCRLGMHTPRLVPERPHKARGTRPRFLESSYSCRATKNSNTDSLPHLSGLMLRAVSASHCSAFKRTT